MASPIRVYAARSLTVGELLTLLQGRDPCGQVLISETDAFNATPVMTVNISLAAFPGDHGNVHLIAGAEQ